MMYYCIIIVSTYDRFLFKKYLYKIKKYKYDKIEIKIVYVFTKRNVTLKVKTNKIVYYNIVKYFTFGAMFKILFQKFNFSISLWNF